jgi:tRNA-binding protein
VVAPLPADPEPPPAGVVVEGLADEIWRHRTYLCVTPVIGKKGDRVEIDFDQFLAVDMRVGRVTAVDDFPEARKPAWKLTIDFGPEVGVKRSSAQIRNYSREELEGRLVVAVVNFPPRQIGPFMSEVLCLGASDEEGRIILLEPRSDVPLGARIH